MRLRNVGDRRLRRGAVPCAVVRYAVRVEEHKLTSSGSSAGMVRQLPRKLVDITKSQTMLKCRRMRKFWRPGCDRACPHTGKDSKIWGKPPKEAP